MVIGERLRQLREQKKLSQGDIQKWTGLLRCYISRLENGHTVPAIDTLEKLALALEVPMYRLFYDGKVPPELSNLVKRTAGDNSLWGSSGRDAITLGKFRRVLGRIKESDRQILILTAKQMTKTSVPPISGHLRRRRRSS